MKYIVKIQRYLALMSVAMLSFACQKDEPSNSPQPTVLATLKTLPPYLSEEGISLNNPDGVLVLSEGALGHDAGHLSYLSPKGKHLVNGLIRTVNHKPLGSVTQDLAIYKQRLYIISQNGRSKQPGGMQHIAVFDKNFRLFSEFTPDVVEEFNVQEKPKHLALAHDNIYFYAGGTIYECDAEVEGNTVIAHALDEINNPLDEQLYAVQRADTELLYVAAERHIYRLGRNLELSSYALPKGHKVLAMSLSPALARDNQVYAWVLSQEQSSGTHYLIKLRNLEQEVIYQLPSKLGERSASALSLRVVQFQDGASLYWRDRGMIYRFDTQTQSLRSIYQSGNAGRNKFYGYMGVSQRSGSIYVSEFVDYHLYREAWVNELDLEGKLKRRYPVARADDLGFQSQGIYTPFCAGIYPIDALYNNSN